MKGKQILLSIILVLITIMCVAWAGLTIYGIDILSQVKYVLGIGTDAESVNFKNTSLYLGVGQESSLDVALFPEDAETHYTLSSTNEDVVKINGNKVDALKVGSCTVKVKTENGLSDYCDISVQEAPDKISIDGNIKAAVGEKFSIKPSDCKKMPDDFFTYNIDTPIAEVSNDGTVKIIKEGRGNITVSTYNGLSKICKLTVLKEPTAVKFSQDEFTVLQRSTYQLSPEFNSGEGCKDISYKSSDEKIAKVDAKGTVTGVGQGTATISCVLFNDVSAQCTVNVKNQFERIRTNMDKTKPMVCLTFDDGPDESNTLSILHTLQKYKARATFFVVGSRVSDRADILKKEYTCGNEIGNHSWDHRYADDLNRKEQLEEVTKTNKAVQNVIGATPTLFRCPGGISCDVYEKNSNLPLIMWSIDTVDWSTKNSKETFKAVKRVIDKGESLDGDIVLMHDIQDSTPKAVENICKFLSKKGYQMVTVSEMAYYKGIQLKNGEIYYNFYGN